MSGSSHVRSRKGTPRLPSNVLAFSVNELRSLLGIGRRKAYALAHTIGRRLGRRLLVPRARLEAWLRKGGAR